MFPRETTSPGPILREAQGAGWIRSSHRVRRRQIPLFTKRVGSKRADDVRAGSVPPSLPPHRRHRRVPHELGVPNVRHATVRGYKPTYERVGARVPTVPVARLRRARVSLPRRPRGDKHPPVPRGGVGGAPPSRISSPRRSRRVGSPLPAGSPVRTQRSQKKVMQETVGVVSRASALVIPPFCKLSQPYSVGLGSTRRWTSAVLGARSRASTLLVARDAGRIPTVGDFSRQHRATRPKGCGASWERGWVFSFRHTLSNLGQQICNYCNNFFTQKLFTKKLRPSIRV